MKEFKVSTTARQQMVDISSQVRQAVDELGLEEGACLIFSPHTTAGVTINEGADPDVQTDIMMALDKIIDDTWPWLHAEGNSAAHLKTSLVGSSATVLLSGGRLALGTWQRIFLCEYDGPRTRRVWVGRA